MKKVQFLQETELGTGVFFDGPFSKVIALPTNADIDSCRSFTLLKALAKSDGNLFAIAFKSEKERQLSLSR